MRVLILGGSGMLGHKLWQTLAPRFDAYVTFRGDVRAYARAGLFDPARSIGGISAHDFDSVARAFAAARPEAVVNCIGIVKQDAAARDPLTSIAVNALFPHRLAHLARAARTPEHRLRLLRARRRLRRAREARRRRPVWAHEAARRGRVRGLPDDTNLYDRARVGGRARAARMVSVAGRRARARLPSRGLQRLNH